MFDEVTPTRKAMVFMFAMLMIAAVMLTFAFLPYREYRYLEQECRQRVEARVINVEKTEKSGIYYYGPMVEYYSSDERYIRTRIRNTVSNMPQCAPEDKLEVFYNTSDLSEVIAAGENTAEKRFRLVALFAGIFAGIGFIDFLAAAIKSIVSEKGKTVRFDKTPDGKSFEEWQEMQKLREAAEKAQAELREEAAAPAKAEDGE